MTSPTSHTRYDIEPPDASDASDATHGSTDLVREEKFQFLLDLIRRQDAKIKHLAEALNQQGIDLTIIRDDDAVQTFKALHMAQNLKEEVENSADSIGVIRTRISNSQDLFLKLEDTVRDSNTAISHLELKTQLHDIQLSTVISNINSLDKWTGLEKHLQRLHQHREWQKSQPPPQTEVQLTPGAVPIAKPSKDKKKSTHKWLFGAQEPSALEALSLSPNL